MGITFRKMQGSGNDFILIDNREGVVPASEKAAFVKRICPRATAVGADGVIFVEPDAELDFRWDFYNADGSSAEMCGNGARCAVVYAHDIGAAGASMTFRTIAGPIRGQRRPGGAKVQLTDAPPVEVLDLPLRSGATTIGFVNTGVPHVVVPVADLEAINLMGEGAEIRYHQRFQPAGANANFMARNGEQAIAIRTYERGVEGETLACGTGSVAAALTAARLYGMASPIKVGVRSGDTLTIHFVLTENGATDVYLDGPVVHVYDGQLAN